MARVVQREDPIHAQRQRDAEVVKQKINGQNPDLVFKSSRMGKEEEGYSRVYMMFEVEGRRYIFYTGIEDTPAGPKIHRGDRDYTNPRLIHHAKVDISDEVPEITLDRTFVDRNLRLNQSLQTIALTAARDGRVRPLGPGEFKATLESAKSLYQPDHKTPLIQ